MQETRKIKSISVFFLFISWKFLSMAIAKNPGKKTPKKKEGILNRALTLTWEQFTSTTTIHGLKHFNDPRGNRFTKFFWVFIPFFCFLCAIALMATFLLVSFWIICDMCGYFWQLFSYCLEFLINWQE